MTERYDQRTPKLLEASISPTLLVLAVPNVVVMMAQALLGLIETYFIGKLGTDVLAGVALVFPVVLLMQMMSGGAMGGASHRPLLGRLMPDAGKRRRGCNPRARS